MRKQKIGSKQAEKANAILLENHARI